MVGNWESANEGCGGMVFGDGVMDGFTSKTEPMGLTEVGCT